MDESTILSIIGHHLSQADTPRDDTTPLDFYLGNPDGREVEGNSTVVSTDVADAIEWIMPQIMKAFTQNNEVVTFDPIHDGDERQAELETQIVYDTIMKDNPGFEILHSFVKDALLFKNGVIKVFYEDTPATQIEEFTGLSPDEFAVAVSSPNIEVLAYDQDQLTGAVSARIAISHSPAGKVVLEAVPPEQLKVYPGHNSISLDNCKFSAQVTRKTASDLIELGIEPSLIDDLPTTSSYDESEFRFAAQNETFFNPSPSSSDKSMQEYDVAECYIYMDANADGIAERCKVLVCPSYNPSHVLSIEVLDYSPWVTTAAILMSHKFRGLSIFDRLKQIQEQKTSLLRNIMDNVYLQNNQRTFVLEGQVNIDDLLVSRPGGIVRGKTPDAITPIATPPLSPDTFNLMSYLDAVRAGRVGVAPEGEVTPQRIGERVGSEGVAQLLTAKEELVGLIVRVIAETGLKPLCTKVRDLLHKHTDAILDYKFKGQWVKTNPAQWPARSRTTVRVGTGSGNASKKLEALFQLFQIQSQIFQVPGQTLVTPDKVYATLDDLAKFAELNGASKYFVDPMSEQGQMSAQQSAQQMEQEKLKNDQAQLALLQSQVQLAQAEMQKAQAQQDNVVLKAQVETLKQKLELAIADSDAEGSNADRQLKKYEIDTKAAIELTKIEAQAKAQQEANAMKNREELSERADSSKAA